MKFGGTSMGSSERIRVAAGLIAGQRAQRPVITVVSAMSKVTDLLLDSLRKAEAGDAADLEENLRRLRERHLETAGELLPADRQPAVRATLLEMIAEFHRIAQGILMLGERPPRSVDEAIAIGERLSAVLMAEHLAALGVPARAISGTELIVTDAVFGNATPLMTETRHRSSALLFPLLEQGILPVVTGFNGATKDGRPTTLGRGGSDLSASVLAAALDASELWIWTDVDGIMTADPRLVPNPSVIAEVTYREAAELAYNGAKVLHPRTLAPLMERGIPVWSKNSFAPDKPGTRIVPAIPAGHGPHAVTSIANVAMISIEPASAALSGTRVMARALDSLTRANAEILAITSSSYRQTFCFVVRREEVDQVLEQLEDGLALELAHGYVKPIDVDHDVGLLAVVGEGMRGTQGLAAKVFAAISGASVNIIAIAQGSSELTISVVVRRDGLERAVRAVHEEFILGK